MLCLLSSQFLANSCSQDTVFSSIFSCVNNAGDLKMAARYFTLEEVLERVVNDEEVSDFDDESEEDLPDVSESENNGDSSESDSEFIEIAMVLVGLCSLFTFGEKYLSFTNNFT